MNGLTTEARGKAKLDPQISQMTQMKVRKEKTLDDFFYL
jgi:hypothetical protein